MSTGKQNLFIVLSSIIVTLFFVEIFFQYIYFKDLDFLSNYFQLFIDSQALFSSLFLGLIFLFIMVISFARLQRRNGYVRYFIFLGFTCGLVYLFTFSGSIFHSFFDPLISTLDKSGLSFLRT